MKLKDADLRAEIATLELFSSALLSLSDPDEVLSKAGLSRSDLVALTFDNEVSAHIETRLSAVKSVPWRLEPNEGTVAEFCNEQLNKHFDTVVNNVWRAVLYGYSITHVAYAKPMSGLYEWGKITDRPVRAFKPARDGSWYFMGGQGWVPVDPRYIDSKLFFAVRQPSYDNPMGEAVLSRAYWPWFFRNHGYRFWARWIERIAGGLTVGTGFEDTEAAATALNTAMQSAVIAVGREEDIKGIYPPSAGDAYHLFEAAMNRNIQKAILGRSAVGDQASGSFAAQKTDDEVRKDRKNTDVALIVPTVQRMIDTLVGLNFPAGESPKLIMGDGKGLSAEKADRDGKLYAIGVRFTPEYISDQYGIDEDQFTIVDPGQQSAPGFGFSFDERPLGVHRFTEAQDAVERAIDQTERRAPDPLDSTAVREAITKATSEEDLYTRLSEVIESGDERFKELLERSIAVMQVLGYVAANQGKH